MFDLRAKQETNRGFGNAYGRGIDIALTPVVFGGLGWIVDRIVGTHLVFAIGFAVFAVIGLFVRTWIGYDADMRREEELLPGRAKVATPNPTVIAGPSVSEPTP